MPDLRVIIIDDDREKREMVRNMLPDYITCIAAGSAEGALDYVKRDGEGNLPDLVILNGDDPRNYGLYAFDWMINRSGDPDIAMIPVIVLTSDEFSDTSLEFLEIGDVTFYEGEIDESDLFSKINEAIEQAEFSPEPVTAPYEETKNIDRLMGHSVKVPGENQRAVVIDMDTRFDNLEAALERGRARVAEIKTLLDAASRLKAGDDDFLPQRKKQPPKAEKKTNTTSSFLDKARKKQDIRQEERDMEGQTIEKLEADAETDAFKAVGALRAKAMNNPTGAYNAQGTIRMEERPKHRPEAEEVQEKRTVVVVDPDLKTRKLCLLFLTQKYNVATFDSGMKTIDYVVKNHVDLLIINPLLPGMSGMSTVSSLRLQPKGENVPVMYIVGDDFKGPREMLLGRNVVGILNKPVKQGVIAQAVEGFFDNYR